MRLRVGFGNSFVGTCRVPGLSVRHWLGGQSLTSPFAESCRFPSGPRSRWGSACAWAAPRPAWHRVRNVPCVQGGEMPPKEREKLPPCFSCFRPSPISTAGKGRVQPGSRLRPSAAWPRASERESELDTIPSVSNAGSLPCRPSERAGSAAKGLAGTGLAVGLKHIRAMN